MFSLRKVLPRVIFALFACALVFSFAQAAEIPSREIWKAGDMSVTIIQDLPMDMPIALFSGPASAEERAKYFTNGKSEAGINVFLLRTGGKIALFDAGGGEALKGRLHEALAGLGVKPENVDFILLTHMHVDHIGGLLREGKRFFPKARLLVSKPEIDSWLALAEKDSKSAGEVVSASAALAKAVAAAYGADDIKAFAFDDTLLPGVMALDASGHTPGHTVFKLTADEKTMLLAGDLLHSMSLQFTLPDECPSFDMDPPKAVATRKRIFAFAEQNGLPIAGAHFPFANAIGTVKKDGNGWKFERLQ